jgi:hypothetical protein
VGEDDGAHDSAVRLSGGVVNKLNVEPKMAALSLRFGKLCSGDDVFGVGGSKAERSWCGRLTRLRAGRQEISPQNHYQIFASSLPQ